MSDIDDAMERMLRAAATNGIAFTHVTAKEALMSEVEEILEAPADSPIADGYPLMKSAHAASPCCP